MCCSRCRSPFELPDILRRTALIEREYWRTTICALGRLRGFLVLSCTRALRVSRLRPSMTALHRTIFSAAIELASVIGVGIACSGAFRDQLLALTNRATALFSRDAERDEAPVVCATARRKVQAFA